MKAHNVLLVSLICLSGVSFICTVIFNALSAVAEGGLFLTIASNISSKYQLDVTPAGWTFSIWSVIYIWNGLWIVYVISTLFRRNKLGHVYKNPEIHPPDFFALWILNNIINIGWLFLWDREILVYANVFLALIPITCIIMLHMSYKNCYRNTAWMSQNQRFDLWCIRILVHNGLAAYATWTSIATILNFGIILKYEVKIEDPSVSNMVLSLIFFVLLFWFLMETFVVEKYVRYTLTIYPVAIFASFGIGWTSSVLSKNDIITVVIIAVGFVACLLRFILKKIVIIAVGFVACLLRFILLFCCGKLRPLVLENKPDTSKELHSATPPMPQTNGHTNLMVMELDES